MYYLIFIERTSILRTIFSVTQRRRIIRTSYLFRLLVSVSALNGDFYIGHALFFIHMNTTLVEIGSNEEGGKHAQLTTLTQHYKDTTTTTTKISSEEVAWLRKPPHISHICAPLMAAAAVFWAEDVVFPFSSCAWSLGGYDDSWSDELNRQKCVQSYLWYFELHNDNQSFWVDFLMGLFLNISPELTIGYIYFWWTT